MLSALPFATSGLLRPLELSMQLPMDVDPVLVGIIAVLLLVIFMLFLIVRRTIKSFTEGLREGNR